MYKITKSDSAMGKEEDVNFRNRRGKEGNQDVGRRVEEEGGEVQRVFIFKRSMNHTFLN